MIKSNIQEQLEAAGIKIDHHESDLYCPVNAKSTEILNNYEYVENVSVFISNIDKTPWYDIPFAYIAFWDHKERRQSP